MKNNDDDKSYVNVIESQYGDSPLSVMNLNERYDTMLKHRKWNYSSTAYTNVYLAEHPD